MTYKDVIAEITDERNPVVFGRKFIQGYLMTNSGKLLVGGGPRTIQSFCENRGLAVPKGNWKKNKRFLRKVAFWVWKKVDEEL